MKVRENIYYLLEPGDDKGRVIDAAIVLLIFLNIIALILETIDSVHEQFYELFNSFELFSLTIFTIEYILRLWSCTTNPRYSDNPVRGRIRFALSPLAIIDALAIIPFFLGLIGVDMRVVRTIRLLRIFRIVKLARYSRALRLLGQVLLERKEELISIFFVLMTLLIVSSSLMYFVEHEVQPTVFPNIPATMWWGIITLTTVGYGDTFPVTAAGQAIAAVIAILGIGMFALPAGILGAAFTEALANLRTKNKKNELQPHCPHCGKNIQQQIESS